MGFELCNLLRCHRILLKGQGTSPERRPQIRSVLLVQSVSLGIREAIQDCIEIAAVYIFTNALELG